MPPNNPAIAGGEGTSGELSLGLFDAPEERAQTDLAPFRFVDLFAGIGGLRRGLEEAGGTCVYSVEIDRYARRTYEANFGRCDAEDVRDVRPGDLPPHDVIAAGFPCQPFSIAGVSKKVSLGRAHGFDDANSGNLFFEIVRLAESTRPAALFLENVKNLRSHDNGRTFKVILSELHRLGYDVSHDVIDARHWVPQHRERTFIVAFRHDVFAGYRFIFPPLPRQPVPKMRDVLDSWYDRKYVLSEHLWQYLQGYARKHQAAGNGFGFGLVNGGSVSRTLSARYHKDGSEILVDTNGPLPRRLTPVECARLMGFRNPRQVSASTPVESLERDPDSFVIPVSDTQAYRQLGNSVVVPVVKHLGRAMARQLRPQPMQIAS